jgi:leucyl/phenylalanyl-tRNA--protein transferase
MQDPLEPEILLAAYAQGIFPMADDDGQINWYTADPRTIIELDDFHVPRTLRQACRQGRFEVRVDSAFREVITRCGDRPEGTWISPAMIDAYERLHEMGFAHSVESWQEGQLAGGLYGVTIGAAFFGESMFFHVTDASKVALVALVERMRARQYMLLDVQFMTPHLERFGATEIPRMEYRRRLAIAIRQRRRFKDE